MCVCWGGRGGEKRERERHEIDSGRGEIDKGRARARDETKLVQDLLAAGVRQFSKRNPTPISQAGYQADGVSFHSGVSKRME